MPRLMLALSIIFLVCFHGSLLAQPPLPVGSTGPYSSTPALSPYLNLLRSDVGPLPNYQQFVRPRLQLRNTIDQQRQQLDRQGRAIRTLSRSPQRGPLLTTGTRAGYLNYSTFYPTLRR